MGSDACHAGAAANAVGYKLMSTTYIYSPRLASEGSYYVVVLSKLSSSKLALRLVRPQLMIMIAQLFGTRIIYHCKCDSIVGSQKFGCSVV